MALISGILFASLFLPLRTVSAAKKELVKVEEATVFLARISEEISAVCPDSDGFSGDKDSISFVTADGTDLGSEKVSYTVKKDDATETATIYRRANFPFQPEAPDSPVLQAQSMVFGFYDGKDWVEKWDKKKGMPLLVSVTLVRKGESFQVFCGPRTSADTNADTDSDTGVDSGGTSDLP